ncbi:BglG family transcription antiterminator [Lactiplantibacillus daowaiensis]|uniref:BglG family transcription antiterminator n=1 Tax=Lactiplantibacillus daowaiensis TaxID=2559918 RepID=A0ABW1S2K5_9LACO
MQLSNRQRQLALKLLALNSATTTQTLAQIFNVSVRTIKSDLKQVQTWLQPYGDYYQAKPHIGIWLTVTDAQRTQLKAALLASQATEPYSTPQERVSQIILLLAVSDGFITTQQIENKIDISKNTVIADLDRVESKLATFQLQLARKNYYGYRIQGSELNLRSILETLLNQIFDYYEAPGVVSSNIWDQLQQLKFPTAPELQTVLTVVLNALAACQDEPETTFDLNDRLTMLARLTIVAVRLSMHQPLNSYQPLAMKPVDQPTLPYQWFVKVMQHYDFPQLQDEYDYVLRGGNPRFDDQNIAQLTKTIIEAVSVQTGQAFDQDSQLQVNLFSHLLTKLSNKYKFTNEYNPFINDIKARHLALFDAVTQALKLNISANPAVVSDSFVAFVTLHFLVSLEGRQTTRKARIIYVCSTGLGVTSLIKKEIERHMTNVEIAGFASRLDVKDKLKAWQPDLVVSIFPLNVTKLPVIQVNPLPSPADLNRIQAAVAKVLHVKPARLTPTTVDPPLPVNAAGQSHELMLRGAIIYSQLASYLGSRVPTDYQGAFTIHVMLAVHRISFQQSYDSQMIRLAQQPETAADVRAIRQIFKTNHLTINAAEISAILQYTRINEFTEKGADQHG